VSKSKAQGTRYETHLVNLFQSHGLTARRLAEQGSNDPGDIELVTPDGDRWIIEAKHRQRLNTHHALQRTIDKGERHGYMLAAVIWKSLLPKRKGQARRVSAGPDNVIMDIPTFIALLKGGDQ
jgi:hypothetical protein